MNRNFVTTIKEMSELQFWVFGKQDIFSRFQPGAFCIHFPQLSPHPKVWLGEVFKV